MSGGQGTPAQAVISSKKNQLARTPTLVYPNDLSDFFMSFEFYDYRVLNKTQKQSANGKHNVEITRNIYNANRENVQQGIRNSKDAFARIALPIPANLTDSFAVSYQNTELGINAGILGEVVQGGNGVWDGLAAGQAGSMAKKLIADFTTNPTTPLGDDTVAHLALRAAMIGSPEWADSLIEQSVGVAANPNLTVLFRGPTLKQHQFSWRLAARNKTESESIRKIIAIFKRAMHPRKLNESTTALLKYPSECLVQFNGAKDNFLYPIRPCVVENFTVNYGPNGTPSFFQETHDSVSIEITVQLQETSYYTRESFGDKSEYGYDGFGNGSDETVNKGLTR